MKVIYSSEMRMLDQKMISENKIPALLLMENAAMGLYDGCKNFLHDETTTLIFCGMGNNGGDGFAVARKLLVEKRPIKLYLIGSVNRINGHAKINIAYFKKYGLIHIVDEKTDINAIFENLTKNDLIIDAIFGTGLKRDINGIHYDVIKKINDSDAKVVSVDIPSGVCADTGQVLNMAVKANLTVTFQYPQPGHFLFPGRDIKGNIKVHRIGIDDHLDFEGDIIIDAYSKASNELKIKKRKRNTHKGSFGKLALLCGSENMSGAGLMCAKAALRSGVGVLHLGIPKCVHKLFIEQINEAIYHPFECIDGVFNDINMLDDLVTDKNALAVGPGITTKKSVVPLVEKCINSYKMKKVFDADALNIIASNVEILNLGVGDIVLTPHPLEFSRLCGIPVADISKDSIKYCVEFAKKYKITILLKGATTIVANQYGQVSMVLTGTNGMAKGGSGDVLTGIIGSLMAMEYEGYDAAVLGAYIAGISGEMAKDQMGDYSMTPMDTIEKISFAIAHYLPKNMLE